MGLFSKCCAKTHLPVLCAQSGWQTLVPRLTRIVVLQRGEKPFTADYDGYGLHLEDYDTAKFVLADVYAGERWEDLPESGYEPGQGFFHDRQLISVLAASAGFACHEDYETVLSDHENDSTRRTALSFKELGLPVPEDLQCKALCIYLAATEGNAQEFARACERYPEAMAWVPHDFEAAAQWGKQLLAIEDRESRACAEQLMAAAQTKRAAKVENPAKPCPCCAANAQWTKGDAAIRQPDQVMCLECGLELQSPNYEPGSALAAWNKRVPA